MEYNLLDIVCDFCCSVQLLQIYITLIHEYIKTLKIHFMYIEVLAHGPFGFHVHSVIQPFLNCT